MTDGLYGRDLANVHHESYGALAREAGPAIVRLLRHGGIHNGLVIELGCGSGILAHYLTTRGYAVRGIDASAAMLRIARRTAAGARFVHATAEAVPLVPCSAVVATGESITYLRARHQPEVWLRRHIGRVARALAPGGLFVFDAIVSDPANRMAYTSWRLSNEWALLADVQEDLHKRVVIRRITTFRRAGKSYRRSDEVHRVGVYDVGAVLNDLRVGGFRARTMSGYGGTALPPRRVVFVARRLG